MALLEKQVGFIGAGNMAEAIAGALIKSEIIEPSMIIVSDVSPERLDYMTKTYGVSVADDNKSLFANSDVVVLSVKPQMMADVLKQIADDSEYHIKNRKLIISIAAGLKLSMFEDILYQPLDETTTDNLPVIRVMPNTPSLVLEGMSGMCSNSRVTDEDMKTARVILGAMGAVETFSEDQMDGVTAFSGSGPAYFFYFVESMVEAAEAVGLSREEALGLSVKTMKGAAALLESSADAPEVLRKKVTSKGGTTEAALRVMEQSGLKENIVKAVTAAAERSKELSR